MIKLEKYGEVLTNVDLKKYNTYGIGGMAKYLVKPTSVSSLQNLISDLKKNNISYYLLGMGSNVILPDNDYDGVIIRLDNLNKITIKDEKVEVEGGVLLTYFSNYLIDRGYVNFAFCNGVPGTVASAVIGNVGCFKHEIFDYLINVTIINEEGNIEIVAKENISYGYRYTEFKKQNVVIIAATFVIEKGDKLLENNLYRQAHQPLGTKNAGSVFRNPIGYAAGKLIEDAKLKKMMVGGAMVSEKHANFIINYHNATSSDIIELITKIKKEIKRIYDIDLELEQIIVKW